MKYIIDDEQLDALISPENGRTVTVTLVPELPVKPFRDRLENPKKAKSLYIYAAMNDEITELRALCQAQAASIPDLESRDFYELMQQYRHERMDAAVQFEQVKAWLCNPTYDYEKQFTSRCPEKQTNN